MLRLQASRANPFGELQREEWGHGADTDDAGEPVLRISKLAAGQYYQFQYADGVEFVFNQAADSVWAFWPEQFDLDYVLTYLAGPIFGCLLLIRGITRLHASAVAVGEKAIALLGPKGAGKSTTAAGFALSGFSVLTDDIVALTQQGSRFVIQPGFRRVCLWPASVEALYGSRDALPRLTETWEKQCLQLGNGKYRFQERALPLAAVYVLGERTAETAHGRVSSLTPRDLLLALLGNTYASYLPNDRRGQEFEVLARAAKCIPGRRVTPHPSSRNVRELCKTILNDFESLAPLPAVPDCLGAGG